MLAEVEADAVATSITVAAGVGAGVTPPPAMADGVGVGAAVSGTSRRAYTEAAPTLRRFSSTRSLRLTCRCCPCVKIETLAGSSKRSVPYAAAASRMLLLLLLLCSAASARAAAVTPAEMAHTITKPRGRGRFIRALPSLSLTLRVM